MPWHNTKAAVGLVSISAGVHVGSNRAFAQCVLFDAPDTAAVAPSRVSSLSAVDIDDDGDLDLVSDFGGRVAWHEQIEALPVGFLSHELMSDEFVTGSAVGDLDGDGHPDILTVSSLDNSVAWMRNDGAAIPSFSYGALAFPLGSPRAVAAGDCNGDGRVDVVLAFSGGLAGQLAPVAWLRNLGGHPPQFALEKVSGDGVEGRAVEIVDLNGDGAIDFLVASGATIVWYKSDGLPSPTFTGVKIATLTNPVAAIAVGRIDPDGRLDVVAASGNSVLWFQSNGGASFTQHTITDSAPLATSVRLAKLNDDEFLDVIATASGSLPVAWFKNDGAWLPSFDRQEVSGNPLEPILPQIVVVADIDQDNDLDAVTGAIDGRIALHTNVSPCPVDIEGQEGCYCSLGEAIPHAVSGDVVSVRGIDALQGGLDVTSLAIETPRDFVLEVASAWVLGGEVVLVAGDGARAQIGGELVLLPNASVRIQALGGSEFLTSPHLDDGSRLACSGTVSLRQSLSWSIESALSTLVGTTMVRADDIDGDEDVDLIASSRNSNAVAWYENRGGPPSTFQEHVISNTVLGAESVVSADLDGDGDTDILAAAQLGDAIAWFENTVEDGIVAFHEHQVSEVAAGARSVWAADIDGDGDHDVLAALLDADTVAWYENLGAEVCQSGPKTCFDPEPRVITDSLVKATSVMAYDMDRDGDLDVLATGQTDGVVAWYENGGELPVCFTEHLVSDRAEGAQSVLPADVDGDGDTDLVVASRFDDSVTWFEHTGGEIGGFLEHVIATDARGAESAEPADVDGDGDVDIVVASRLDRTVAWLENSGDLEPRFEKHVLASNVSQAQYVSRADLDRDGRLDVVVGSTLNGEVRWFRQESLHETHLEGAQLSASRGLLLERTQLSLQPTAAGVASVKAPLGIQVGSAASSVVGEGVLVGKVWNGGAIVPHGGSKIEVDGSYVQMSKADRSVSSGVLRIELSAHKPASCLEVSDSARLSGTLIVEATDDFDPPVGAVFEVLSASEITGRFDVAFLPALSDRFLAVQYLDADGRDRASVVLTVEALSDEIAFDPVGSEQETGTPTDAILADINVDGFVDLLLTVPDLGAANQAPGAVLIFYNDGNNPDGSWRGFASVSGVQQLSQSIGIQPDAIAVDDLNGDGRPDIVIANRGIPGNPSPDSITALIAATTEAPVFVVGQAVIEAVGNEPRDVAVVDLDDDGYPDIAAANAGSDSVTVLWNGQAGSSRLGRGDPLWEGSSDSEEVEVEEESCPLSIRPGTFESRFGRVSLAVASSGTNSVSVIRNDGGRRFTPMPSIPVGEAPVRLSVVDVDLDDRVDLVTTNEQGGSLTLILNDGPSGGGVSFRIPVNIPLGANASSPRSIAVADFDDDSDPDFAVVVTDTNQSQRVLRVLRNDLSGPDGQIALVPVDDPVTQSTPLMVVSEDVDNDERQDIVIVGRSDPTAVRGPGTQDRIATLLSIAPCPGDVDSDGDTDLQDFLEVVLNFGLVAAPGTAGDLNADGVVDVFDFNIVAGDFGCGAAGD